LDACYCQDRLSLWKLHFSNRLPECSEYKKRPKKKGINKYFNSKFGLNADDEKELDRGVHGDYVTGQIGAATRMKARKMKSRQLKASNASMAPGDATSSHAPVHGSHQSKRSRKHGNIFHTDAAAATNTSSF